MILKTYKIELHIFYYRSGNKSDSDSEEDPDQKKFKNQLGSESLDFKVLCRFCLYFKIELFLHLADSLATVIFPCLIQALHSFDWY